MGKRTWIDSDIWDDTDDLDNECKLFYVYLLTNRQRTITGYYEVNLRHIASDLGFTESRVEKVLMKKQKYWLYDRNTRQVLIPKFTRYNIVKSKQQFTALNAELNKLKPSHLHTEFLKAFEEINGIGSLEMIDERFKSRAEHTSISQISS